MRYGICPCIPDAPGFVEMAEGILSNRGIQSFSHADGAAATGTSTMYVLCAVLFLCVMGCSDGDAMCSNADSRGSQVELRQFQYTGHRVVLVSKGCDEPLKLELCYLRSLSGVEAGKQQVFANAGTPGTLENRWLQAYLNQAAIDFANGRREREYVEIYIENPLALEQAVDEPWCFGGDAHAEWCIDTLAWRCNGNVIRFLPEGHAVIDRQRWVPLTAASYADWYRLLDQRISLNDLLGR